MDSIARGSARISIASRLLSSIGGMSCNSSAFWLKGLVRCASVFSKHGTEKSEAGARELGFIMRIPEATKTLGFVSQAAHVSQLVASCPAGLAGYCFFAHQPLQTTLRRPGLGHTPCPNEAGSKPLCALRLKGGHKCLAPWQPCGGVRRKRRPVAQHEESCG